MSSFSYFVSFLMAPLVLSLGLIGNLTALVILFKGKLKKIGPVLIYKLLFIFDTFCIFQILQPYLQMSFNLDITIFSKSGCKLYLYFNYAVDAISPFMLIYISAEKYISIAYPAKRRLLTRTKNQFIYFSCIFAYCSAYTLLAPIFSDLVENTQTDSNGTNFTYLSCDFTSFYAQYLTNYLDLINREMIPSILTIFFSFMLVMAIFRSRLKVSSSTLKDKKRLKRDVRLAINCFFMNLIFIVLNTPSTLTHFFPNLHEAFSQVYYLFFVYILCFSYGVNFYVVVAFNSLFREQFLRLLGKKPKVSRARKQTRAIRKRTELPERFYM